MLEPNEIEPVDQEPETGNEIEKRLTRTGGVERVLSLSPITEIRAYCGNSSKISIGYLAEYYLKDPTDCLDLGHIYEGRDSSPTRELYLAAAGRLTGQGRVGGNPYAVFLDWVPSIPGWEVAGTQEPARHTGEDDHKQIGVWVPSERQILQIMSLLFNMTGIPIMKRLSDDKYIAVKGKRWLGEYSTIHEAVKEFVRPPRSKRDVELRTAAIPLLAMRVAEGVVAALRKNAFLAVADLFELESRYPMLTLTKPCLGKEQAEVAIDDLMWQTLVFA